VFAIATRPEDDDIDRDVLGCREDEFDVGADGSGGDMQMVLRVESKGRIGGIAARVFEGEGSV